MLFKQLASFQDPETDSGRTNYREKKSIKQRVIAVVSKVVER